MKTILTSCTAMVALLSFLAVAQASPGCANVEVRNLVPGGGALMLAAYSDAATFRKTAATIRHDSGLLTDRQKRT